MVGIIPAGGSGERLGADRPKAFAVLGGRPMVEWSLEALRPVCSRIVVAAPAPYLAPGWVEGGSSRSASVRNAVEAAPEATVFVIHDAARPLVTSGLVRECLDSLDGVDGVIAASPVSDTVHVASPDFLIAESPDRSTLWAAQTPQVFRADVLRRALEGGAAATDEAALVAAAGGTVRLVEGPSDNIKVTTPTDLRLAEALLRERC
ncbi:MAG TPA: 2-C-methyl-D-erythritol 4-phosphate cytidylyltransferase [Thermoleophilaceae bacterium]|nr:2-C-methyl-D-erythritol 4-phosphate cytidylyltransferase [Thermoleophilaceae bacterium]